MTDTTNAAPVAWRVHPFDYGIGHEGVYAMTMLEQQRDAWLRKGLKVEPLYVAPQVVVVPLTDEQIVGVMHSIPINAAPSYHIAFARAIEQAHGIGETP